MSDWEVVGGDEQHANDPTQSDWGVVPYDPQEESFLDKLPRNILTGLTHAGRGLHNLPHDIASGVDYIGSGIGRALGAKEFQNGQSSRLADYLPYDEQSYADVWGQKGRGTQADNLIQKGIEFAPAVIGGLGALRSLKLLPHLTKYGATKKLRVAQGLAKERGLNKPFEEMETFFHGTPEKSANKILQEGLTAPKYSQKNALLTNKPEAAEAYGARINGGEEPGDLLRISIPKNEINNYLHPENTHWTSQSLKPRGHEDAKIFGIKQPIPSKYISKVGNNEPYHLPNKSSQFTMTPELIEDAKQFFPNTLKNRDLFEKAKMGDYDAIFRLQAELGKLSAKRAKAFFNPEANITGHAGLETQGKVLNEFTENLNKLGHEDISNLMKAGRQDFKKYMKFKPYRNALYLAGLGYLLPKNELIDIGKKYFKSKI